MEQFISSVVLILIPMIITYATKRNKSYRHKTLLEQGQKKIEFINSYYSTLSKLSNSNQIEALKPQLSSELEKIKSEIDQLDEEFIHEEQNLNLFQKLFLTFKPLSLFGWIWAIIFYASLIFLSFGILGFFVDDNGDFSSQALESNMRDGEFLLGMAMFLGFALLIRWFGMITYRRSVKSSNISNALFK